MTTSHGLLRAIKTVANKQKLPDGQLMLSGHLLNKAAARIEELESELSKTTTKVRHQTVGNCLALIEGLSNGRQMRIEIQKYHSELFERVKSGE